VVTAIAATAPKGATVAAQAAETATPLLGEPSEMTAPAPMVAAGAASTTVPTWHMFPPLPLQPLRQTMQASLPLLSGKWGSRRRALVSSPPAAVEVEGRPRLHPTTKSLIPAFNTIHMFSAQSKLCFVRDWLSRKDFLVDTGTTLSLLPHQSAAAATRPKLQSV
jgi:hypothetical protein